MQPPTEMTLRLLRPRAEPRSVTVDAILHDGDANDAEDFLLARRCTENTVEGELPAYSEPQASVKGRGATQEWTRGASCSSAPCSLRRARSRHLCFHVGLDVYACESLLLKFLTNQRTESCVNVRPLQSAVSLHAGLHLSQRAVFPQPMPRPCACATVSGSWWFGKVKLRLRAGVPISRPKATR